MTLEVEGVHEPHDWQPLEWIWVPHTECFPARSVWSKCNCFEYGPSTGWEYLKTRPGGILCGSLDNEASLPSCPRHRLSSLTPPAKLGPSTAPKPSTMRQEAPHVTWHVTWDGKIWKPCLGMGSTWINGFLLRAWGGVVDSYYSCWPFAQVSQTNPQKPAANYHGMHGFV